MLKNLFVCGFWGCTIKNRLSKQIFWRYFWLFFGSGKVRFGHRWVTYPWGLRIGWSDAEKLIFVQIWRMCNWILITWKWAQKTAHFLGGCWVLVGSPEIIGEKNHPPGLRMGWADAEKFVCVRILRMYRFFFYSLFTNKNGLGKQVFWRYFGLFFSSGKVPFGHRWVTYPWGLSIGWSDKEKLICEQIWRMCNWILIIWKWDQGAGCFLKGILAGFWVLVRSPEVMGE